MAVLNRGRAFSTSSLGRGVFAVLNQAARLLAAFAGKRQRHVFGGAQIVGAEPDHALGPVEPVAKAPQFATIWRDEKMKAAPVRKLKCFASRLRGLNSRIRVVFHCGYAY